MVDDGVGFARIAPRLLNSICVNQSRRTPILANQTSSRPSRQRSSRNASVRCLKSIATATSTKEKGKRGSMDTQIAGGIGGTLPLVISQ